MGKTDIPRLELETFAQINFKVPLLDVQHYPYDAGYFSIRDRKHNPVKDYISPNRRQFYKIFHITGGTGILTIGLHQYEMGPRDISFLHPDEIMSWQTTSQETEGHFCLIHPHYFGQTAHIIQLFRQYPYFQPSKAVVQLSEEQSEKIDQHFGSILKEEESRNEDKKQAIFLHLQMILLEAQRAGKNLTDTTVPQNYRYIHDFLSLLDSAFQIKNPEDTVKTKTATEFAEQLHVHPNYLNTLIKTHTGKTLRQHIQERLLYEAKLLLTQTDWDIKTISYNLGFSDHAAFTTLFNKKEKTSPSKFREAIAVNI